MSLKASKTGIIRIKQARKEKGWATNDERWLEKASLLVEPAFKTIPPYAHGISYGTWTRFLGRKAVNVQSFKAYCTLLGLEWQDVVDRPANFTVDRDQHWDWQEAPDVDLFYGRGTELTTLEAWLVKDRCRLVGVFGIGGIGKTALVAKLATQVHSNFERIIWRSLHNAPPIEQFLSSLLRSLSPQAAKLPSFQDIDESVRRLLNYLCRHRCLLIWDNVDAILQSGAGCFHQQAGGYRAEYEDYGQLLLRVGETTHQSCLLLTSREKLLDFDSLEGSKLPTRSLQLAGVDATASRKIVQLKGAIEGSESEWQSLSHHYAGHPLALKVVSTAIQELFCCSISAFLQQGTVVFGSMRQLLDQQFDRLSELEKQIMYWLAVGQEPVSVSELLASILAPASRRQVLEAVEALKRRSLIETSPFGYTQQLVVMEYMTDRFFQEVYTEITTQKSAVLVGLAFIQPQAENDLNPDQVRMILEPFAKQLQNTFGTKEELEAQLQQLLVKMQTETAQTVGCSAESLLNGAISPSALLMGVWQYF